MAKLILGMAVPHSGMLGKPADTWLEDGQRDRNNPALWYKNRTWTFEELAHERRGEGFETFLSLEERRARAVRCADALNVLRSVYAKNKPDVAIIIGKDQREIFIDTTPSLALFSGDKIENGPPQRSVYAPQETVVHQGHPQLARYLMESFAAQGFDMTEILKWPANVWMQNEPIVPHAFGFIYHQIMADQPPPNVPIFLNTFYPPTQPSMPRVIQFGKALLEAITAWDQDKTVAIIASGGLSHFVCDENIDRMFLDCFKTYDFDRLAKVDPRSYQSGTSEVKLYVPVMVAMQSLAAEMTLVDYVPCYRTEAGTGEGMGFMYWLPGSRN